MAQKDLHQPKRQYSRLLFSGLLSSLMLASMPGLASAATPTISGTPYTVSYTEDADPVLAGSALTVVSGDSYDGKYIEFSVNSALSSDVLSLQKVATALTADTVVSVVGNLVYIGNGTTAAILGSIDETNNGASGKPLRINFASDFSNSSFESAIAGSISNTGTADSRDISTSVSGWTIVGIGDRDQYIDIGTTFLGGRRSTDDVTTYPANSVNKNDDLKPQSATFSASITTSDASDGTKSLRLVSNMTTAGTACEVVHGPAAVSDAFNANANDVIYFDWKAAGGSDNYDVFGYLFNVDTGEQIKVIDSSGTFTNWATKATTITNSGSYRFVFINGTHDLSCGRAAGASLFIDNIRVFGNRANDAAVQKVARLVTYKSTSNNPPASRVVSFTAVPASGSSASTTFDVQINPVNDAPVISNSTVDLYNTASTDVFESKSGALAVADSDDTVFTYFIKDGSSRVTLDVSGDVSTFTGTYGTLSVNRTSGSYTYIPDASLIDQRSADTTDVFTIEVEDSGGGTSSNLTDTATLTFNIFYETVYVISPAAISVDKGETTAVPGFSVGGTSARTLVTVELINPPSGTKARITATSDVTAAEGYANAFNEFTIISFIGIPSQLNNALASLKVISGNTAGSLQIKVTATKYLENTAFFNGNYYESIRGNLTWTAAAAAARAKTYLGMQGYLVTITSQAEQDFVFTKIPNAKNIWIGANDATTEDAWIWESGTTSPDAGKQFWSGTSAGSKFTGNGLNYANWCTGEPNNADTGEDYAVTNWSGSACWNDLPNAYGSVEGYVVEYGNNTPITNSKDTDNDVTTVTINTSSAPTNSSMAASSITTSGATLNATVNANGASTTNRFCISISSTLNNCATTDGATVDTVVPSTNPVTSGRSATSVAAVVTGLAMGTTYYFQSYSTNSDGGPIYGAKRSFTTSAAETPGKPTATAGNGRAIVTVTPPTTMTPTSYTVTSSPGGFTCTVTGASGSCTVLGLSNGTGYTFTVVADYSGSASAASVASDPVTPRAAARPQPPQTDVINTPQVTVNPYQGTSQVSGNFTRPINSVTLNGSTIANSLWTQKPNSFELDTKTLPPGKYEVAINNGSATPLTYTFEKPAPITVAPVIKAPTEITNAPKVLEGNKEVPVTKTTTSNLAGFNIRGDLWGLDLSAQNQSQTPAPVIREDRMVLQRNLRVLSIGTGFMPFSTVRIFIFSEPTEIGTATVKPDGSFETISTLPPGINLGEHLLQVNGVSPANELRSTTLKVLLAEPVNNLTIGFAHSQRVVASSYSNALKSIFDLPVKKIVLDAYSKPTDSKSDRKLAANRATAAKSAITKLDSKVEIKIRNRGGKVQPLCQEFKNRCVVITVRR